jgi:cholesterol transport system auxiliary component
MKYATHSIAYNACYTGARALFIVFVLTLTGCALTRPTARPAVYDFGPGRLSSAPAPQAGQVGASVLAPLVLDEVQASTALDGNAVLYRLAYTNAQQLRPYALARWSMPPAQLVRQRLREQLGQDRTLLEPGAVVSAAKLATPGALAGVTPVTLRLELEEFSQLFEAPGSSVGLLRLRATLTQASPSGAGLLAQRIIVVQRPAPSADVVGGVQALQLATDAAAQELAQWLQQLGH